MFRSAIHLWKSCCWKRASKRWAPERWAIQDMGAAGLTSSSCEMASRGGVGIEIDLARVPQRETGMTPYEIMLSESQERMLLVAEHGREREVFEVFHKWGLDAVEMGRVTDDGMLRVLNHGRVAAEIPAHAIAEQGPVYQRPIAAPQLASRTRPPSNRAPGANLTENFSQLLASPTIASKKWITDQYDSMVRTNTRVGPGAGDAAVRAAKGTNVLSRYPPTATAAGASSILEWRDACRRGSRAKCGLRWRTTYRRDELPEFRQS